MAQELTVSTRLDDIYGAASEYADGVVVFKGIRYAADACGANRLLPPQPAPPIEGGFEV